MSARSELGAKLAALACGACALLSGCVALDDRQVSMVSEVPIGLSPSAWTVNNPDLGLSGNVYPWDDALECTPNHAASECAPKPVLSGNAAGKICSQGTVEQIKVGKDGQLDYVGMWGAFIAVDLANPRGLSVAPTYDAPSHGVVGFSFDFASPLPTDIRVEISTPSTTANPPIWLPDPVTFASPLQNGSNQLLLQDVQPASFAPSSATLDPSAMQSLRFHMSTVPRGPTPYSFCISNLSVLVE